MLGKVMIRKSFANVVRYVLDKEKNARIIAAKYVLTKDSNSIIKTFEAQAGMNPRLKNKVGHIALSFSPNDKLRCTDEFMNNVAMEYLMRMGIANTQYIIVRHFDHKHPHMHIVYNRVDNFGKTIPDKNQRLRNKKACIDLTKRFKLYISKGKEHVNRDRLRQPDKSKYYIYDVITAILPNCQTWRDFCNALSDEHIDVELVKKGNTDEVQGVVFLYNGYRFNGSKIDREYSYYKLQKKLFQNIERFKKRSASIQKTRQATTFNRSMPCSKYHSMNKTRSVLSPSASGYSRNAEFEIDSSGYGEVDDERTHYHRSR